MENKRFSISLPEEVNNWYKNQGAKIIGVGKAKEAYIKKILIAFYRRNK